MPPIEVYLSLFSRFNPLIEELQETLETLQSQAFRCREDITDQVSSYTRLEPNKYRLIIQKGGKDHVLELELAESNKPHIPVIFLFIFLHILIWCRF